MFFHSPIKSSYAKKATSQRLGLAMTWFVYSLIMSGVC